MKRGQLLPYTLFENIFRQNSSSEFYKTHGLTRMTFKVLTPLPYFGDGGGVPVRFEGPLIIHKGDITHWFVDGSSDAIVNPANETMLGGGVAEEAIHIAAGPKLREACFAVPEVCPWVRCPVGKARITPGFDLPASRVIHTVGPVYGLHGNPKAYLRDAYKNSLSLAKENNIQYIAFPAISCGFRSYPYEEAAMVALSTVKEFVSGFKEVHFVLFLDDIYDVWLNKAKELFEA